MKARVFDQRGLDAAGARERELGLVLADHERIETFGREHQRAQQAELAIADHRDAAAVPRRRQQECIHRPVIDLGGIVHPFARVQHHIAAEIAKLLGQ